MGKEQRALTQGWCHMYDGFQPWPFSQSPHNCKKLTEKGNSKLVLCLFLRLAKEPECCIDPCKDPNEKIIRAKPIIAETCRNLPCCDDCSIYKDVGSLPPCYCVTNEGL